MKDNHNYNYALEWMDATHTRLHRAVPKPKLTKTKQGHVFRYQEKSPEQAIILKLARIASGLRAARCVLQAGLLQEHASLCRMVDEYQEDVAFLAIALAKGDLTSAHKDFLDGTFAEETSKTQSKSDWVKGRHLVSRKKIRAYIANESGSDGNPSDHIAIMALLGNSFSGYVHAAAPQVLEMYDAMTDRFLTSDLSGSTFYKDHLNSTNSYFARGLYAFGFGAAVLGYDSLSFEARNLGDRYSGNEMGA